MIPQKTVQELINKHAILEKDLSSEKIDKNFFAEKSKEYSDLSEIIIDAKKYISFENDKAELEKILKDETTDKELLKLELAQAVSRPAYLLQIFLRCMKK